MLMKLTPCGVVKKVEGHYISGNPGFPLITIKHPTLNCVRNKKANICILKKDYQNDIV
jgi:hypothetical protein